MLLAHRGTDKLGRQDLLALPSPESTETHTVIPHAKLVESTLEALSYRRIEVLSDEYAVSKDGMKLFGALTLSIDGNGVNLVLGLRNSHDKSFALGMVAGFRVLVCDNLAFRGEFFAVAKRHSKKLLDNFPDTVAIGVDRVQRHFQPMQDQINVWKNHELPDVSAKEVIYRAFIEEGVDAPKHLARTVHNHYFEPTIPDFEPRNLWSLQNAFTSAFKELEAIPQYRATASLGEFFGELSQ